VITTSNGQRLIVNPSYPPKVKGNRPFQHYAGVGIYYNIVTAQYSVEITWQLKDGHFYDYLMLKTDFPTAQMYEGQLAATPPFTPGGLQGGVIYNAYLRGATYSKQFDH
jgi:hypothetical protein